MIRRLYKAQVSNETGGPRVIFVMSKNSGEAKRLAIKRAAKSFGAGRYTVEALERV